MIFEYVTKNYFRHKDYNIEKIVSGENGLMLYRKGESHFTYFLPYGLKQVYKYELSCEFKTTHIIRGWRLTEGEVPHNIIENPLTHKRYPVKERISAALDGKRRGIKGLWGKSKDD